MSLESALSIASSGLANINAQLALVSQNVANAGTPGYAVETGTQQSLTADGVPLGVHTGAATLQVDQALNNALTLQNAMVSGLTTTQTALHSIDSVLGTVGAGNDLGSLLGNVQNAFSTLLTDPSNQTQQAAVVSAASTLAQGINSLSQAYTQQSQAAQSGLVSGVATINETLASIGRLSNQIIAAQPLGESTADLENQRNAQVQTLSNLVSIKTVEQPDGDLSIFTTGGVVLPTHGASDPLSIASSSALPGAYYPGGGLPGIMLNGSDVTSGMTNGSIGANLTLRNQTMPTSQAELDEFAANLSSRFAAQGLTLFTDPTGAVPSTGGTPAQAGYVGYAATVQVNPAVTANTSLVRDGTNAIAGSATGATAFTPNPSGGPAGFTTLVSRVLNYSLGAQVQGGVTQPAFNTTGLGADGSLSAPFGAPSTLSEYATDLVSAQSQQSATTSSELTIEQSVQTGMQSQVGSVSGIKMDTEMSMMISLQNAYGANARVITAMQAMFTQLLQAVQ